MMKKIEPPFVDDPEELRLLSLNTRLNDFALLDKNRNELLLQYAHYERYHGSPWEVDTIGLGDDLVKRVKSLYESPPSHQLQFIEKYRDILSPDVCPMCGGLGKGTLDHYLPKDDYPDFTIFSKNLVPACDCNSKRNTTVKGDNEPERVIHPYYDTFIRQRVYKAKLLGDFESPEISMILVDASHKERDVLKFHLEAVIINNKILNWLDKRWGEMFVKPHRLLRSYLPSGDVSKDDVKSAISEKLIDSDEEYDTPNNWWSFLYAGLLDCDVRLGDIAHKVNEMRA
jgi:hypothetical protein